MTNEANMILADGRWQGPHGIGRFSTEVLARLTQTDILTTGPHPLSIKNLFWQSQQLLNDKTHRVFFTPGFNPSLASRIPVIFTIHDLIHLHVPGQSKLLKKIFYQYVMKPAAKKAHAIVTVSHFSKKTILEWLDIPEEKIIVSYPGVSATFKPEGTAFQAGFSYLLHVGNTKAHKNVARLIEAFAKAKIDRNIKLICTGILSDDVQAAVAKHHLEERVISKTNLNEETLASLYRGALGVVFPSLYEGFGLPVVEGMASGVPVLTSNLTSIPEIANNCAILVDPYNLDALTNGIEELINNTHLRHDLATRGLIQAKQFTWDKTAASIQQLLNQTAEHFS
ncbi:MAG: glycosyltransferase family 1 protein [Gammaproteobacteria bacterium]